MSAADFVGGLILGMAVTIACVELGAYFATEVHRKRLREHERVSSLPRRRW